MNWKKKLPNDQPSTIINIRPKISLYYYWNARSKVVSYIRRVVIWYLKLVEKRFTLMVIKMEKYLYRKLNSRAVKFSSGSINTRDTPSLKTTLQSKGEKWYQYSLKLERSWFKLFQNMQKEYIDFFFYHWMILRVTLNIASPITQSTRLFKYWYDNYPLPFSTIRKDKTFVNSLIGTRCLLWILCLAQNLEIDISR